MRRRRESRDDSLLFQLVLCNAMQPVLQLNVLEIAGRSLHVVHRNVFCAGVAGESVRGHALCLFGQEPIEKGLSSATSAS